MSNWHRALGATSLGLVAESDPAVDLYHGASHDDARSPLIDIRTCQTGCFAPTQPTDGADQDKGSIAFRHRVERLRTSSCERNRGGLGRSDGSGTLVVGLSMRRPSATAASMHCRSANTAVRAVAADRSAASNSATQARTAALLILINGVLPNVGTLSRTFERKTVRADAKCLTPSVADIPCQERLSPVGLNSDTSVTRIRGYGFQRRQSGRNRRGRASRRCTHRRRSDR